MRNLTVASQREMIWEWARAESDSARWFQPYHQYLSPRLLTLLAQNTRNDLNDGEWALLDRLVQACRAPLLSGLMDLDTTWYNAECRLSDLASLRLIALSQFRAVCPKLTLGEFAALLESGAAPQGEDNLLQGYQSLRASFNPNRVRGLAIVVCQDVAGPFVLLEGYTRLSVLVSQVQCHELTDGDLKMILGCCPRLSEWHLNNDPRLRQLSPI